jgi:iron complex transport system substrate-binding protein
MQGKKLPTIGSDVNTEKVASYKPDLIIAIYDTVNKKTYNTYSKIAPTIIQSDEYKDEETPWNEQTLLTGRALGKTADAEALVAGVDADFAAARAANPEFANLTLVANFYPDLGTGEHWLLGAGDPRRQLFDSLGFMAQDERDGVSEERSEVLDRDVLVVNGATKEQMTKLEVFSGLDVVTEDRTVFIPDDTDLSAALAYGSVISLPYALEQLQPLLAAAADGNPATKVG